MTPWKGLILGVIVSSLVAGGNTECTKATIADCARDLAADGVGVSAGGVLGILASATDSSIQSACSSKFPVTKQCLGNVVASCAADNIIKTEASGAVDYLTYLCSQQGLAGLRYLPCLEREEVRQALLTCNAPFENMLNQFQDSTSFGDILNYFLGGNFLKDFCDVITSARLCHVRAAAELCSVEASMYNDELFQKLAHQVSGFLKCADHESLFVCPSNPCMNGGTCFGVPPDYTSCTCATGYSGDKCQHAGVPTGGCVTTPCQNGGECALDTEDCICTSDFTGTLCQDTVGTTGEQTASGFSAVTKSEGFIAGIVCVIVVLGVVLVVLYCVRVRRKNRLVESVQDAVHPEKGIKIPPDF